MGFPDFNDDGRINPAEAMITLGVIEDSDPGSNDELGDEGGDTGVTGGDEIGYGCLTVGAIAFVAIVIASAIASCVAH